jgi:hypothetical protein
MMAGGFVGSWRLASFETRSSGGEVSYPFGPDAGGVLTYTPEGRVSATIWRSDRRRFAKDDQQQGAPEEYADAVQSYVAYVGTYEVDRPAAMVTHHVEQSIFPNWNGTAQVRNYRFGDDGRLELTTPPTRFGEAPVVGALVWQRLD